MRRAINIITTILISLGFIACAVFVFSSSYVRLWECLKDFWNSLLYYLNEVFGLPVKSMPTVGEYSEVLGDKIKMPDSFDGFKSGAVQYFSLLFNGENFGAWAEWSGSVMVVVCKALTIALPLLFITVFLIKRVYGQFNRKHGKDTIPLKVFKGVSKVTYQPLKRFICGYTEFLRAHSNIWICWAVLWCLSLNLASIIMGFLAYYFYFVASFDFRSLYPQFRKLLIDLRVPLLNLPYWSIGIIAWLLFERFRRRIALARLRHYEARNCGFINELAIVSMTCGSMGKKKTTAITDMALSQEVMFRQKALDILQNTDLKFPYFPWIKFELELKRCMEYHTVYNLATVREWVQKKRNRFYKHGNAKWQLYGYDYERYGMTFYDGLKRRDIFFALETYAKAYLIYVVESSLIVSNYSIRTDNVKLDAGNFPMWAMDFFPKHERESRHAHILDFDMLRLGKKLIEDNLNAGAFEFGVVNISEVGKERGNTLELKEVKKSKDEANQKNDLFNSWLKMCRHSATVDNYPFIKVFTDEQRPESWGADARDLCDIVNIAKTSEQKLALPFYTIEDMISEWAFNRFINLYYDFRYRRGDNTLLVHILKSVTVWLWRRNIRIYNNYAYSTLKIEKERGTMDGKVEKKKYYLMNKKIYSRRFSTDCFSDYFNDLASKAKVGLNDFREYVTERASVDELKAQNSYFINSLYP